MADVAKHKWIWKPVGVVTTTVFSDQVSVSQPAVVYCAECGVEQTTENTDAECGPWDEGRYLAKLVDEGVMILQPEGESVVSGSYPGEGTYFGSGITRAYIEEIAGVLTGVALPDGSHMRGTLIGLHPPGATFKESEDGETTQMTIPIPAIDVVCALLQRHHKKVELIDGLRVSTCYGLLDYEYGTLYRCRHCHAVVGMVP